MYGLKQSPRNWNIVLDTWLKEYGFEQSRVDTATYIFPGMCVLLVHVDDIIGACLSDPWWDRFRYDFGERFDITDLGNAHWVLGMEVLRDRTAGTLTMNQRQYLTALLEKHGMADCHAV